MSTLTDRLPAARPAIQAPRTTARLLTEVGRGEAWTRGIRILAPLGALSIEGFPALVGTVIVQEGGLWIAGRTAETVTRRFAMRLFLAAYGLRMLIVFPTHVLARAANGNGALYRDDYTNDLVGEWLLRIARGDFGTAIFPGHQYLLESLYSYILMGIYAVFGYTPLLPKVLNIGMAALCAVLIFDITRRIFSRNAAIIAAVAASVLPSLIVWSIATLKETLVFFAALVALRTLQHLTTASRTDRHLGDAIVLLAAALGLLLYLRSSVVLIFLALLGVVIVARAHVRLERWQVALTAATIVAVFVGGLVVIRIRTSDRPLTATFEDVALQIRHRRAQEAAGAGSQLRPETDVLGATGSTLPAAEAASDAEPFSFVSDVLDPLGYALFAPAPWQAESPMEFGASAEMPVWYVFVFASLLAWRAAPRQRLFVVCLVGYGIANWLILAAVEGNLGNLMRHRLMLDPMLLILGAAGLDWLWRRRSAIQKAKLPDHQYAYANHEGSPNRE